MNDVNDVCVCDSSRISDVNDVCVYLFLRVCVCLCVCLECVICKDGRPAHVNSPAAVMGMKHVETLHTRSQ